LFECEVFVESEVKECYLVARSNHEDRPRGFGGYYLYLHFKDKQIHFKKEIAHENKNDATQPQGYSERLSGKDIDFTPNQWHKAAIMVKNIENGKVMVEGKFDNTKILYLDEGKTTCGNKHGTYPNTKPFIERGKWCFLRTNEPKDIGTLNKKPGVYYRNAKITNLG
jgi:hypothetical protein